MFQGYCQDTDTYFRVGVIPNRQLKSATRWHPANGGFGEIPEPTVKVRMREVRRKGMPHVSNSLAF